MNFVKALGIFILASMILTACSDVNPTVSTLRGELSNSPINPVDSVSNNGSYIKTDHASSGTLTSANSDMKMTLTVSKGNSLPAQSASGQYKLNLDESIQ